MRKPERAGARAGSVHGVCVCDGGAKRRVNTKYCKIPLYAIVVCAVPRRRGGLPSRVRAACRRFRGCAVRARRTPRVATSTAHTEPPPALSFRFTLGSISRHLGHCRVIGHVGRAGTTRQVIRVIRVIRVIGVIGHVGRAGTTRLKKPGQSDVVVSWCGAAVGAATAKETATLCALP